MDSSILQLFSIRDDDAPVIDAVHAYGVVSLVIAGFLSGLAVLGMCIGMIMRPSALSGTHVMPYFVSLLFSNLLQAFGGVLNLKWIIERAVEESGICTIQAIVKQAGNVGTAVWSFVLSICVFRLMFLRAPLTMVYHYIILCFGWLVIAVIVAVGPLAVQSEAKGAYFGPSGYWCWITDAYPHEQIFLEYFWEFFSAFVSFILYVGILLRVRGNLVRGTDGWHLRFVPSSERWQLAINRDWLDSSTMGFAAILVWYPVTYVLLLVPVAIARFIDFSGKSIPFGATIFTDTLFNLQGLANAFLLFGTRNLIPESAMMHSAPAPRKVVNMSSSEAVGITPFTLTTSDTESDWRRSAASSFVSVDSQAPLNQV
ncbi:hypothetical protein BDW22DRAFT_1357663 [Trametopsis cervina]|nr:hypothetical protein BDW22DRAFT_1357663 [Trametopsis cervina]